MKESQEFWAQIAAAAVVWACFVLMRRLAHGSSRSLRTVNFDWQASLQYCGPHRYWLDLSVTTLAAIAVRTGIAPYLATTTITICTALRLPLVQGRVHTFQ
jgi:hypothetical protein